MLLVLPYSDTSHEYIKISVDAKNKIVSLYVHITLITGGELMEMSRHVI